MLGHIGVSFGAMCEPPSKQVGIKGKNGAFIDKLAKATTLLRIHGILSDSEAHKCNSRLIKMIVAALKDQDQRPAETGKE